MTAPNSNTPNPAATLSTKARIIIGLSTIAAAVLVQQFAAFSVSNAFTNSLTNWMHVPMFALITATARWIWPTQPWWKLGLGLALLALASEGIQFYTGRQPSLEDLSKDLLGACISWLWLRQSKPAYIVAWIITIIVTTAAVPSTYLVSYHHQVQIFPILFTPDDWRSMHMARLKSPGELVSEHPWLRYANRPVLATTWHQTRWPGVHFAEPIGDWSEYDNFRFDIFNLEASVQPITVGVRHVGRLGTARYYQIMLQPGENQVRLDVQKLITSQDGQVATIRHLMLYTTGEHAGKSVLIGRIWLD